MKSVEFYTSPMNLLFAVEQENNIPEKGDIIVYNGRPYQVHERRFDYDANKIHIILLERGYLC